MEYLQFGFAGAFCIILYMDQRTIIKAFTRSSERLTTSIEKMLTKYDEKKDS